MAPKDREVGGSEPFGAALDDELRRVDLLVARLWQLLSGIGLAGAGVVALVVSRSLGLWTAAFAAVALCWFSLTVSALRRGVGGRVLWATTTLFEGAVPWVSLAILVPAQGAEYALGSWVPPMLFMALIMASVARLRPLTPIVAGISSSCSFLALHFFYVKAALPPNAAIETLFRDETQLTRSVTLAATGALGWFVSNGLRNVFIRAESSASAQRLFGKYRLLRQIASGGMGTVHEAVYCPEGGFERRVAVKRVHPHLAEQPKLVQEFRTEAEISARLVHPNIVQVFDFGRVGDTYFLAMEYVDGLTLGSMMRRFRAVPRPVPLTAVAHLGREILAGLAYSHQGARGVDGRPLKVIHRDLSPANVLLSRTGEVKISDFGLARALKDAASTRTRTVAGHVGYMAPEQARGESLDTRCDLFGVGVVLWELLAGQRLFLRENEAATLLALVADPVPKVSSVCPDVDPSWDDFLGRALARTPSERFSSATEMALALDALMPPRGRVDVEELGQLVAEALAIDVTVPGEEDTLPEA